jgi:hypothetical protein
MLGGLEASCRGRVRQRSEIPSAASAAASLQGDYIWEPCRDAVEGPLCKGALHESCAIGLCKRTMQGNVHQRMAITALTEMPDSLLSIATFKCEHLKPSLMWLMSVSTSNVDLRSSLRVGIGRLFNFMGDGRLGGSSQGDGICPPPGESSSWTGDDKVNDGETAPDWSDDCSKLRSGLMTWRAALPMRILLGSGAACSAKLSRCKRASANTAAESEPSWPSSDIGMSS